jgi:DNA-binding NtrC family response regulator
MVPGESIQPALGRDATTILVAEDEVLVRLDVSEALRAKGHNVLEASSAEEAIQILKSGQVVSLVFTDVRMPGALDGLDLARYVRTHHPDVPVLITSGHLPADEMPEELGQLIAKPYNVESIMLEITEKLRKR